MVKSFVKQVEEVIVKNWDLVSLSNYKGADYNYGDVAKKIAEIHILLDGCGVKKGDKIALCGRNSSEW